MHKPGVVGGVEKVSVSGERRPAIVEAQGVLREFLLNDLMHERP